MENSDKNDAREETFRSYVVDDDAFSEAIAAAKWHDDERLLGGCEQVLLCNSHLNNSHIFGTILCGSLRISFVPVSDVPQGHLLRSRIFNDIFDLPLLNVCGLYIKASKDDDFRQVTDGLGVQDKVHQLKIVCKDFKVWNVYFNASRYAAAAAHSVINSIWVYAFPLYDSQLYAFNDVKLRSPDDRRAGNQSFDWQSEIDRCSAAQQYRLSDCNKRFSQIQSYPSELVVPYTSVDSAVVNAAKYFRHRRRPVWSWSSQRTGFAVFRSSLIDTDGPDGKIEWQGCMLAIRDSHHWCREPVEIKIDVTPAQIHNSWLAVKKLLVADSDQTASESGWLSAVDSTGWLQLVHKCLTLTRDAAERLTREPDFDRQSFPGPVVLSEDEGRDMTAIVSSLVQLCLDSRFRTRPGFIELIRKEWLSLGHPFLTRMFPGIDRDALRRAPLPANASPLLSSGRSWREASKDDSLGFAFPGRSKKERESRPPASFLLFLDCTAQILRLWPLAFDMSEHYLIAVYDLALTGTCSSFLMDFEAEHESAALHEQIQPVDRLDHFYTQDYQRLFRNPTAELLGLENVEIYPDVLMSDVRFWNGMFLRWTDGVLHSGSSMQHAYLLSLADQMRCLTPEAMQGVLRYGHSLRRDSRASQTKAKSQLKASAGGPGPSGDWKVQRPVSLFPQGSAAMNRSQSFTTVVMNHNCTGGMRPPKERAPPPPPGKGEVLTLNAANLGSTPASPGIKRLDELRSSLTGSNGAAGHGAGQGQGPVRFRKKQDGKRHALVLPVGDDTPIRVSNITRVDIPSPSSECSGHGSSSNCGGSSTFLPGTLDLSDDLAAGFYNVSLQPARASMAIIRTKQSND